MATRPQPPVSVLLTPVEVRIYRCWRSRYTHKKWNDKFTPVPNALEYAAWKEWPEGERSRCPARSSIDASNAHNGNDAASDLEVQGFVLTEKCRHPLYPNSMAPPSPPGSWVEEGEIPGISSHCPVCTLHLHQNLIDVLSDNWEKLGGPWRTRRWAGNDRRIKYSDTTRAYHKAKVDLVNTMRSFEDAAESEKTWEATHPTQDTTLLRQHSATKALDLYNSSIAYPVRLAEPEIIAPVTSYPNRRHTRTGTKTLTFSPDTPENTNHRLSTLWTRSCPSHDRDSPHACSSEEGYWDTSHCNSWHYSISQCRILLMGYTSHALSPTYRDLNAGADRGMSNVHVCTLIQILEDFLAEQDAETRRRWVAYFKLTSDYFLVYNDERSEGDAAFDSFQRVETLVGSLVEGYAREIGDIDDDEDEEGEARKRKHGRGSVLLRKIGSW